MSNSQIGYALVVVALVTSVLLARSPDVTRGVSSSVFWLLAGACGLVIVIALALQFGPSVAKAAARPKPDEVDHLIKEAEWYLEVGDPNDAWQAYIKAKRAYERLPAAQKDDARDRILALYGELEQATKK